MWFILEPAQTKNNTNNKIICVPLLLSYEVGVCRPTSNRIKIEYRVMAHSSDRQIERPTQRVEAL